MPECKNVRYIYDGSFDGFLCCVFASFYRHELPAAIEAEDDAEPSLYADEPIQTEADKAARVYASLATKIHPLTQELVRDVFLSCMPQRELAMLHYLHFAYKRGSAAAFMPGHALLAPLLGAQRALHGEAHLLLGFVRFEDVGGALVARIHPKNFALPYLQAHFCGRFAEERFLIYDETHHAALMYQPYEVKLVELDTLETPPPSATEAQYQTLWKRFYDTIEIKQRRNPRGRMTHCPKRYWPDMSELRTELDAPQKPSLSASIQRKAMPSMAPQLERPQPEQPLARTLGS